MPVPPGAGTVPVSKQGGSRLENVPKNELRRHLLPRCQPRAECAADNSHAFPAARPCRHARRDPHAGRACPRRQSLAGRNPVVLPDARRHARHRDPAGRRLVHEDPGARAQGQGQALRDASRRPSTPRRSGPSRSCPGSRRSKRSAGAPLAEAAVVLSARQENGTWSRVDMAVTFRNYHNFSPADRATVNRSDVRCAEARRLLRHRRSHPPAQ